jgi:hypothetical protein
LLRGQWQLVFGLQRILFAAYDDTEVSGLHRAINLFIPLSNFLLSYASAVGFLVILILFLISVHA